MLGYFKILLTKFVTTLKEGSVKSYDECFVNDIHDQEAAEAVLKYDENKWDRDDDK